MAVKAGNNKLLCFILDSVVARQDYYPSKATPSGVTQLAIESNDSATIELLVKHATTHQIERCWKRKDMSDDVLRNRLCFAVTYFNRLLIVIFRRGLSRQARLGSHGEC